MNGFDQIITSGRIKRPRRTFLFGVPGVGKTTWATCWPGCVILPVEQGSDDLDVNRFPPVKDWTTFIKYLSLLVTEKSDYETVAIDTMDALEKHIWWEVCRTNQVESVKDLDWGKGYAKAMWFWQTLTTTCDDIVAKGINVVLVAHTHPQKFEDPAADSYHRYAPKIHHTAAELLMEWCDEVLFCGYRVNTKEVNEGFNRTRARAIGTGERVMWTSERPSHRAKNRLDLPDEMPLDFSKYREYLEVPKCPAK